MKLGLKMNTNLLKFLNCCNGISFFECKAAEVRSRKKFVILIEQQKILAIIIKKCIILRLRFLGIRIYFFKRLYFNNLQLPLNNERQTKDYSLSSFQVVLYDIK